MSRKSLSVKPRVIDYGEFPLPKENYALLAEFVVEGEPARKSNQRRIVKGKGGKPIIIKSQKAMDYAEAFLKQVPAAAKHGWGSADDPLALWVKIYYASGRPDLSSEMTMDLLQMAGVIQNDRYLRQHFLFGGIDTTNPRSIIRVYRII